MRQINERVLMIGLMTAAVTLMAASPFEGAWCLTSPQGGAVWMKVDVTNSAPAVKVMWEIGGVEAVARAAFEGDTLVVVRPYDHWYMTAKGMRRDTLGTDTLRATLKGDTMEMKLDRVKKDGAVCRSRAWWAGAGGRCRPGRTWRR